MAEKYGTYLRIRSVRNKLRGFVGAGGLPVRDISEDFIRLVRFGVAAPFCARFNRLFINALQRHGCEFLRIHTGITH